MDKTKVITTLCEVSGLDIESSSYSLLAKIQQHLKQNHGLEEIATYTHNLSVLTDLLVCLSNTKIGQGDKTEIDKEGKTRIQLNQDVVESVCFPLLGRLYPVSDLRPEVLVLLGIVGKLAAQCVQWDERILTNVLQFVAMHVDKFIVEKPTEYEIKNNDSLIDIYVLLEILRHVLNSISQEHVQNDKVSDLVRLLFFKLTETLEFISLEAIGSSCIPNLLRILRLNSSSAQKYLEYVWKYVKEFSHLSDRRKQYMLLCGFANYFFPVSGKTVCQDLRADNSFWKILQEGLYNKDTINRKRSLYLLKRIVDICDSTKSEVNVGAGQAVFWWRNEKCGQLSKLWEDFILLAEVFEEKQVHVIKPLLPRMKTLVNACAYTDKTVTPLLHTSWLTTILLRCSIHESLLVNRWMADTVLSLDFTRCPMMEQGSDQYLAGPMLYSLREAKLYVREPGSPAGTMPVIAEKLIQFFSNCSQVLDDSKRALFFSRTVENISAGEWGPIPLLCICRGLAQVPPSPCLGRDTVLGLRKLLTGYLVAMDTYFRGAIQGYIVQILIKLTDKCKVRLEDFMQILSLANREESFRRGTALWDQCVVWLHAGSNDQSEWSTEGIQQYLEASVTKYLQTDLDSKYSTADSATSLMVARLLLLASDAAIATKMDDNNSNTLIRITQMLVTTLNSINSHAYMSTHKADKALLLLNLLVKECSSGGEIKEDMVTKLVFDSVSACQSEVLIYISRQMSEAILTMSDLSLLEVYTDSVKLLVESMSHIKSVNFGRLVDTCITVLSQPVEMSDQHRKLQHLSAMCFLGTLANFLSHDLQKSHDPMKSGDQKASQDTQSERSGHTDLRNRISCVLKKWKLVSNFPKPTGDQSLSQQEWGKVSSLFLEHQWNVVQMGLLHGAAPWCDMLELLTLAEDTLTVGVERTSVILLKCLRIIIPQVKDSIKEERLVSVLGTCWSSFQESRRILAFWDVLEAFVQTAYHSCLLQLSEDSPVISALKLYADQLLQIGTDKNGVMNILATQLCRAWSGPNMVLHAGKFTALIVDLCMFGSLVRRGVRQIYEICAAFEGEGNACPAHGLIKGVVNEDILVRVNIINFLCRLKPDNQSHCCLATSIIRLCMKTYDDVACGSTNRFANSLVHRQRHRLIQTVLLLEPFVMKDYADELWTNLWLSLETETQPSVRHVLEWVAMRLMFTYQHLRQQLWLLFRKYQETKNLTLCSLLCIVIHMGPHLPAEDQTSYFRQAIPNILPWCMAHHFHTRIYSSAVLAKLWEQCKLLGLHDVLKENSILNCIVDFSQQNCNSTRNVQKLLDSFFFKYLDFERDFTLETIYTVMSQMTSLTEEDWIYPELFDGHQWKDGTGSSFIKLRNEARDFEQCEPGLWKYISLKAPYEEETTVESAADDNDRDVQKKVMPWRQMMLDEEAMLEVEHGVKQHIEGGLVVVTSLISKVPNLGGLCRTSEIFGVSEYVLGKMGYVNDKAFQGLSVTAHMWVPITEVNESKLEDYLQQKRQEGYTLVGVEQTANSVCLTEYTFPEKTLLLLGNEKEGIPVELISLLDVCVEIPQQGVIRSLNVHVSGAILIWEYRRQQLMKAVSS